MKTMFLIGVLLVLSGCSVTVGRHANIAGYPTMQNIYCFPCFEANQMFGWGFIWNSNQNLPVLGYVYE